MKVFNRINVMQFVEPLVVDMDTCGLMCSNLCSKFSSNYTCKKIK